VYRLYIVGLDNERLIILGPKEVGGRRAGVTREVLCHCFTLPIVVARAEDQSIGLLFPVSVTVLVN